MRARKLGTIVLIAVCAAGGPLQVPKQAGGGVTFALALSPFAPDWRVSS